MTDNTQNPSKLRVAGLDTRNPTPFEVQPTAALRKKIAATLELIELRKLRFTGQISPSGRADWTLTAELGATVVQPCVLTLAPVTTRIDVPVSRLFLADYKIETNDEEEIEIPEDDTIEPLQAYIDLEAVMVEALSLALPLYPKAENAALETTTFTEGGITPMSDDDARPFAGLSALRDKLAKDEE